MKKVINLVKKRQKSSQSSGGDDRSTGGGSFTSSVGATSSVLQCQRSSQSPDLKYNVDTNNGKDKSLSKLHAAVWREDLEKVRKYVKQGKTRQFLKLSGAERAKRAEPHLTRRLSGAIGGKLSKWVRAKRAIEIGEYVSRASKASINSCDICGVARDSCCK